MGLIAGVFVHRLTPSPTAYFATLLQFSSRSRVFGKGKEMAATQATKKEAKRCLSSSSFVPIVQQGNRKGVLGDTSR